MVEFCISILWNLDIKREAGYRVRDIFNEDNEFFIYDKSSSETVKKYDILYIRTYPIGDIMRIAGGGILRSVAGPIIYTFYIKDKGF